VTLLCKTQAVKQVILLQKKVQCDSAAKSVIEQRIARAGQLQALRGQIVRAYKSFADDEQVHFRNEFEISAIPVRQLQRAAGSS
jgi:hypothetical protein